MNRWCNRLYLFFIYFFLYAPLLLALVLSFNSGPHIASWQGFSLKWYLKLMHNSALIEATLNSLLLSSLAATLTTLLGLVTAVVLYRYRFFAKRFIIAGLYILVLSPDIIMGISFVVFFIWVGFPLGFTSLLISHITFTFPFVAITILSRLSGFNSNILEAAEDLGASEIDIFRYIIVPITFPALLAGWLMSFTLSIDDVIISFFVSGPSFEILPVKLYSMIRYGVKPEINALCAIMFVLTFVIIFIFNFLLQKRVQK